MFYTQNFSSISVACNCLTIFLLLAAYFAIRKGNKKLHRTLMLSALFCSTIFLAFYVLFHLNHGILRYNETGLLKVLYFLILIPHTILAVALLPMILMTVLWALQGLEQKHKKIAPYTLASWLFVSVTGVILFAVFSPVVVP